MDAGVHIHDNALQGSYRSGGDRIEMQPGQLQQVLVGETHPEGVPEPARRDLLVDPQRECKCRDGVAALHGNDVEGRIPGFRVLGRLPSVVWRRGDFVDTRGEAMRKFVREVVDAGAIPIVVGAIIP